MIALPHEQIDELRKTGTGGTIVVTHRAASLKGFDAAVRAAGHAPPPEFETDNDSRSEAEALLPRLSSNSLGEEDRINRSKLILHD